MPGHVADAEAELPVVSAGKHVIIIAADFLGRLHIADNLHAGKASQFFRRGKHHLLQTPGDIEFRAHAQIFLMQLLVEHLNFRIRFFDLLLGELERRNIMRNAERANNLAMFVAQRHFGGQRPTSVQVRLFIRQYRLPCPQNLLLLFILRTRLVFRKKIKIAFANHLSRFLISHRVGMSAIRLRNPAFAIFKVD